MDPRWQSTTHVQTPPPPTMHDIRDDLRRALVLKVLEQVSEGHWSAVKAAAELRSVGLSASGEKVKAAMTARDEAFEHPGYDGIGHRQIQDFLVGRLARPLGAITQQVAS